MVSDVYVLTEWTSKFIAGRALALLGVIVLAQSAKDHLAQTRNQTRWGVLTETPMEEVWGVSLSKGKVEL